MLQCQRLTHRFSSLGALVLEDVSLDLTNGEFVSLLGPSGCGKSTILKMIAGLIRPHSGEIRDSRPVGQQRTGYVFQEPRLIAWRTVQENLALPFELSRVKVDHDEIFRTLDLVGLSKSDAFKLPHMLSGGMKMRVSLARALLMQPTLLLFDEPFAALDELLREQLNEDLNALWREGLWTGLFVTHTISEAVFLSERVLVMSPHPGRIVGEFAIEGPKVRDQEWRNSLRFQQQVIAIRETMRSGRSADQEKHGLSQTGSP